MSRSSWTAVAVVVVLLSPAAAHAGERPTQNAQDEIAISVAIGAGGIAANFSPMSDGTFSALCDCHYLPTKSFGVQGGWAQVEAQIRLRSWFAVALFVRPGALAWSGAFTPSVPLDASADRIALDPQRGDGAANVAVGGMIRFLPGRWAIDVGVTSASGSAALRSAKTLSPAYGYRSEVDGQLAFGTSPSVPTIRLSFQGSSGFFLGAGYGEGFVRMAQPGGQIVTGYRDDAAEVLVGAALLYDPFAVARVGLRVHDKMWITADALVGKSDFVAGLVGGSVSFGWRGFDVAL